MDSESNSCRPYLEPVGSILWFEYLLDSTLLEKQLQRTNSGLFIVDYSFR